MRPRARSIVTSKRTCGLSTQIATAVAVYAPDQRLAYYNQAFVDLWQLDPDWLSTGPRDGEVLDRMRALGRLPEQADFRLWKQAQLASYGSATPREDFWYLPDGRTVHTVAERGTDGGVTYLYEDVTERLSLESATTRSSTFRRRRSIICAKASPCFASDGRLKLFNPAFADIWQLDSQVLSQEPHVDVVIAACRALLNDDAAWSEVKSAVTSIDDQRKPIEGQLARPDGSALYYAGLPLPDGGHVADLCGHHGHEARRACADRADRGPGSGRRAQERLHLARLL